MRSLVRATGHKLEGEVAIVREMAAPVPTNAMQSLEPLIPFKLTLVLKMPMTLYPSPPFARSS
jgi:hypothetical protein